MAQKWKVGVIGAGRWGKKHVEEYAALGAELTVSDLVEANRKHASEKFGAKTTDDYRKILQDKEIKYVSVCTLNESHYSLAKEALEAGKNVLVEKPLCSTVEEGKELTKIAKSKGVQLAVGHLFRFNNAANKVKQMLSKGEFGKVFLLEFKWTNLEPDIPWLYNNRDVIYDLAPHPFDLACHVLGTMPSKVTCVGSPLRQDKSVEAAFITAQQGGALVNMELSWVTPMKERQMVLVGSKKSATVDLAKQKIVVCDNETKSLQEIPVEANNLIRDELENFLVTSRDKKPNVADAQAGIANIRLIQAAQKSMAQGRAMEVGES